MDQPLDPPEDMCSRCGLFLSVDGELCRFCIGDEKDSIEEDRRDEYLN